MDLPLVPLRTFRLAVAHQSFNEAARHLGITQPAVTQQIRRLERAVGTRLFRRDGRRLVLTETGQILATFAQRIFQLVDAARDALQGASALRTGHLKIGASRTAGSYYVSSLLERFKRCYPGVRVSLSVGNTQVITAGVLDFVLHAGLVAGQPHTPPLEAIPAYRDRLLAVLPRHHPLARKRAISVGDLAGHPLVLREPGSATRRIVEDAFRAHGIAVDPSMELESNEAIKSAVAAGIGVAVMARAAVASDVAARRLVVRPLHPPLHLEFALIYHRDRVLSPVLAAFLALLPPRMRGAIRQEFGLVTGSNRLAGSSGGSHG